MNIAELVKVVLQLAVGHNISLEATWIGTMTYIAQSQKHVAGYLKRSIIVAHEEEKLKSVLFESCRRQHPCTLQRPRNMRDTSFEWLWARNLCREVRSNSVAHGAQAPGFFSATFQQTLLSFAPSGIQAHQRDQLDKKVGLVRVIG
jgi:hypothetical protein